MAHTPQDTAHHPARKAAPTGAPEVLVVEMGAAFTARLPGGDWFQPAGRFGRGGMMPRLARRLIAEGVDPTTPIRAMRGATQVWRLDHPLSYWAALSASEPDGSSVKMVRYVAMPSYWDKGPGAQADAVGLEGIDEDLEDTDPEDLDDVDLDDENLDDEGMEGKGGDGDGNGRDLNQTPIGMGIGTVFRTASHAGTDVDALHGGTTDHIGAHQGGAR